MACNIAPELVSEIRRRLLAPGPISKARIARDLHVALSTVKWHWNVLRASGLSVNSAPPEPPEPEAVTTCEIKENERGAQIEFTADRPIRTVEDALAYGHVDTSVWRVERMEVGGWQAAMKVKNERDSRYPESAHLKQLWRIKLYLKRIQPAPFHAAFDAIFDRMAHHAPNFPTFRPVRPKSPHLLEIDLFDVHIGKLAWEPETGQNYDLNIAADVFQNAVEDLLSYAAGFEIEQIILPIGQDFFQVDNLESATTAGTRVDSDGRYAKIIETGEVAIIRAIEHLMPTAPVKILYVPGNHDRLASYHLARTVAAWFRNTERVTVDLSPRTRKFVRYGVHLLGYTHGHREKHASLPTIMATECPEDWGQTQHRAWRIGHLHKAKATRTVPVDTYDGVEVRTLQSLSGRDAWHYEEGYVGGKRAAEAFVLAKDGGASANFQAYVRETPNKRKPRVLG